MPDNRTMIQFDAISAPTPTREGLADAYASLHAHLDSDTAGGYAAWDSLRREIDTWSALVHLRFAQNTTDATAKADREYADALAPTITEHDVRMKRRLLAMPGAEALAGAHALRLWQTDITTFDPAIAAPLEQENRLRARYTELLAGAKIDFDGKPLNLAGPRPVRRARRP